MFSIIIAPALGRFSQRRWALAAAALLPVAEMWASVALRMSLIQVALGGFVVAAVGVIVGHA